MRTSLLGLAFGLAFTAGAAQAAPQASLTVTCGTVDTCNATDTPWTLGKTGVRDGHSVTWTVTATRGAETDRVVTFNGGLTVVNTGTANATIGNIVVNLQRKVGKNWVTAASDIANATAGDGATVAKICNGASSEGLSSFTENAASGALEFTDATNNTVFSLVPQVQLAPAGSLVLTYSAKFDATTLAALGRPVGAGDSVRLEVIVSFGNAGGRGGSGASCPNVDVNGNGSIQADEANARSVPCRTTLTIPALERSNAGTILSDFESDLGVSGTVTYMNYLNGIGGGAGSEPLGDTASRLISVAVDGGTDGGRISNCARLDADVAPRCNAPVALRACNTQTVPPEQQDPPPPPPPADVSSCTYTQGGWGGTPHGNNPASILQANFPGVFPSGVEVGIPGAAGFSMTFSSSGAVGAYLPAGGTANPLNADLSNPTSSSSGVYGGQVLALQLNVSMGTVTVPLAGTPFGLLVLHGTGTSLDGMTVAAVAAVANAVLGGAPLPVDYTVSGMNDLATNLNESFDNCAKPANGSWGALHLSAP